MNDRYYRTIRIEGDAKSIAARPSVNRFRMGRYSQTAFRQSSFRTGTMADGKNTVFARNHGLPIVQLSHSTRGLYERRADRRYGMRQQLDWIRHPSHTRADAGNSAHGRNGQAQFQTATGSIDRRVRCHSPARYARSFTRQRQHNIAKGI